MERECEGNREKSLDIFSLRPLVNIAEIERKRMTRPIKYTDEYFMDWILCNGFGARVSIIKLVATIIIMMNQKKPKHAHTHRKHAHDTESHGAVVIVDVVRFLSFFFSSPHRIEFAGRVVLLFLFSFVATALKMWNMFASKLDVQMKMLYATL